MVRLSAAKALRVVVDDFEFSTEELQPFLPTSFERLFNLLKEVQECDTKVRKILTRYFFFDTHCKHVELDFSVTHSKADDGRRRISVTICL